MKTKREIEIETANHENTKNVMKFLELFPKTSMKKDGTRIVSYKGFDFELNIFDREPKYYSKEFYLEKVKAPKNFGSAQFQFYIVSSYNYSCEIVCANDDERQEMFKHFENELRRAFEARVTQTQQTIDYLMRDAQTIQDRIKRQEKLLEKYQKGFQEFEEAK